MSRITTRLIAFVILALLLASQSQAQAQAQSQAQRGDRAADRRYCAKLSDLYIRYVGRSETGPHAPVRPDAVGGTALAQCEAGNTAQAIPTLERKLRNAGFTLPPRN